MQKYRATRFINRREAEYCEFDSADDATAQRTLIDLETKGDIDWETAEDSDCTPASYDVKLFMDRYEPYTHPDGRVTPDWVTVAENIELPSQKPYSGAAVAFVKKVAALKSGKAVTFRGGEFKPENLIDQFEAMITEARKLCGMED